MGIMDPVRKLLSGNSAVKSMVVSVLNRQGYYNITGLDAIRHIEDFRANSGEVMARSRAQTPADVEALRKKYEEPIFGEMSIYRLLELQAQVIDPTNLYLYCGSQLTHTLQIMESMEEAGVDDRELLATTLIHDLGKLAVFKGEKWENIEGGGKFPIGDDNRPGAGLANCTFKWDHADIVHARLAPYVSKDMQWLLRWHSIQTPCEPYMDAHDRSLYEKYFKTFVRHDRTFIFYHLPKKRLDDYVGLIEEFFPKTVLFCLSMLAPLGLFADELSLAAAVL
ncbi:inositol oxygenase family protein [Methylocella sp.]|uniref:inositol oxygenase family protein n=1 Tax=Methylocella sp. TaxID=1978226 RepID=UPI0037834B0A